MECQAAAAVVRQRRGADWEVQLFWDEGVLSPWRRNDGIVFLYFSPVTRTISLKDEDLNAIMPMELVNQFLLIGWLEKKLHFQSANLPVLKFQFLLVIHGNINFVWRSCDPELDKQNFCCLCCIMSATWIEDDDANFVKLQGSKSVYASTIVMLVMLSLVHHSETIASAPVFLQIQCRLRALWLVSANVQLESRCYTSHSVAHGCRRATRARKM